MSDGRGGGLRADAPPSRQAPGPKLQVQRSLSRDTITIHFSAQGKEEDEEEEEEEELYGADAGALEGFRPKETLFFESRTTTGAPGANAASCAVTILPTFGGPRPSSTPPTSSSWPSERPLANPPPTSSGSSSPCKSAGLSSSGPFLSLVRSSSNDAEAREPAPPSHARHRHLMKSFVKSLSADSSKAERQDGSVHQVVHHAPPQQQAQACQRPPPRNMQLLKQFSQPRLYSAPAVAGQVGGDSKTAPSSPTTSPDGRSFFKVQEVEAKIEDTRRRLSEVMSDPLQLFTKLMGEESSAGSAGSGAHRARLLSSSASELSGIPAVNGHSEGYDYSIKEEDGAEGEEDEETPTCGGPDSVFFSFPSLTPAPASAFARSPSLTLGRCSMSALVARQEDDDDFCELYSEDFDLATDTDAPNGDRPGSPGVATGITGLWTELDVEEEEEEEEEGADAVPWMGLVCLTQLLYCYFVLPLPAYVSAVVRGIFAGFALAVVVLWLSGPRKQRRGVEPWNVARLHIKEPDVVKGWMNEIHSYDPELYHATLTHSVYVRLEGSVLRLSKPNRNISRRAAHNEPKPDVTYISQKIYDLSDGKIYLMPHGLARKRVWNKKYPICIELAKQDDFMSNARAGKPQAEAAERAERGDAGLEKDDASAEEQKKPTPGGGDLTIYLFGRTGREKEEWFRRFLLASQMKSNGRGAALPKSAGRPPHTRGHEADSGSGGRGSSDEPRPRDGSSAPSCCSARREMTSDYHLYMAEYVKPPPAPAVPSADGSPGRSPDGSPQTTRKMPETSGNPAEAWLNAFLGRIFWDFLREKYWADIVSKKIQMKLSKIRLPYVMNELTLTELDMGFSVPKILGASQPSVDPQGLWFDAEVSYTGSFLMTLETKMNLTRLGKEGEGLGEHGKEWSRPRTYCLADSDEESSSAGSSDEEDPPEPLGDKAALLSGGESYVGGHRPSKIMRFVDKIAKSKYFQKATETEFIKKKMEEVANTPLVLTVEVQECRGTLAVNVPPPPTDRIWYGFRSPPHLVLKARPKLGEREVTLVHVTDWIEKKLDQEFQKIFVMPNMDDLWLPIMHSAMDTRSNTESNDASKAPETEESEASSYM